MVKKLEEDRDSQQRRLDEVLELHRRIVPMIRRVRMKFIANVFLLTEPIIVSLFMLMMQKSVDAFTNYFIMSFIILVFALGMLQLIVVVLQSTDKKSTE